MVLHHGKEYMNKKSHMQNLETLMLVEVASFRVSGQGALGGMSQVAPKLPHWQCGIYCQESY